jgi:hypothetical protein
VPDVNVDKSGITPRAGSNLECSSCPFHSFCLYFVASSTSIFIVSGQAFREEQAFV